MSPLWHQTRGRRSAPFREEALDNFFKKKSGLSVRRIVEEQESPNRFFILLSGRLHRTCLTEGKIDVLLDSPGACAFSWELLSLMHLSICLL